MAINNFPRGNDDDQNLERARAQNMLLRQESAQVDRELNEAAAESRRLQAILRQREEEVQLLRQRVAAMRAKRNPNKPK